MCKHSYNKLFTWFAFNLVTGRKDWLCVGCCECGEVLKGSCQEYEVYLNNVSNQKGNEKVDLS